MGKVTLPHRIGGFMKDSVSIRIGDNRYEDIKILTTDKIGGGYADFYYEYALKPSKSVSSSVTTKMTISKIGKKTITIKSTIALKEE